MNLKALPAKSLKKVIILSSPHHLNLHIALDLMVKLLDFDPKNRMTAAQALNHPFLYSVMQQKLAGSFDVYQNGGYSPAFYDRRNSLAHDGTIQQQIKSGAVNSPQRFGEKDSLYLDYGKPEINGKVDTITSGSHNNSLLLTRADSSANNSQPNSAASSFAKNAQRSGSFKVHNSGTSGTAQNQSFLKAAIFRNMQKNNEEEKDDSYSPQKSGKVQERRYSDFVTNKMNPYDQHDRSPQDNDGEMEENPKLLPHEGKVKRSSKLVGSPVKGSTGGDKAF
jgi:serine/threonine protein kinase